MKSEKIDWVRDWLKQNNTPVDILNSKFVDDYINEFNPSKVEILPFGANRCPELGKLLSWGYKNGYLNRGRVSISCKEVGFPNWIYVYSLFEPPNGA